MMKQAINTKLSKIVPVALSAQAMLFMQAASAEPFYGHLNAYNRAIVNEQRAAYAANSAAAYNQAATLAAYNRAAAYNQLASAAAYNRAAAYNQALVYNPYAYNPYYRPSVFTTHPILSGTLLGGGVGALGGAAIGALAGSDETTDHGKNIAVGTAIGAGSGAAVGMGIGLIRNKMLYGSY